MKHKEIERLQYLCTLIPPLLSDLDEKAFALKPSGDTWSKKEIMGHLIDDASNIHETLARLQLKEGLRSFYDQHKWNRFGYYEKFSKEALITLWEIYNRQLLQILMILPDNYLKRECNTETGILPAELLLRNYMQDLELHLKMIVNY